jgi:hypothetical protein
MAIDDESAFTTANEFIRLYGDKAELKADQALRTARRSNDAERVSHWMKAQNALGV